MWNWWPHGLVSSMVAIHRDFDTSRGDTWTHLVHLDAMMPIERQTHIQVTIVSHDRRAIVAHSPRDHGHDGLALMACNHREIVAINRLFTRSNGLQFSHEFPFKNRWIRRDSPSDFMKFSHWTPNARRGRKRANSRQSAWIEAPSSGQSG